MIRLIVVLLLGIVAVSLLLAMMRLFAGGLKTVLQPDSAGQPPSLGGSLKKDPVCGTFVLPDTAITATVEGRTLYFCSEACRSQYIPSSRV